jgi:hypothetical protein
MKRPFQVRDNDFLIISLGFAEIDMPLTPSQVSPMIAAQNSMVDRAKLY